MLPDHRTELIPAAVTPPRNQRQTRLASPRADSAKSPGRCQFALSLLGLAVACGVLAQAPETATLEARERLLAELSRQGIEAPAVLEALRRVPREEFVPEPLRGSAYDNRPLPIGSGQTISQPYIVALMSQLLGAEPGARVLEIGTGSGYQAAVLAELGLQVYTIEILPELADRAGETLRRLGYESIRQRVGDGYRGWPEEAPFDGVIVTAAPDEVPAALVEQLRPGGRMVIPVGPQSGAQVLQLLEKNAEGDLAIRDVIAVRFVPMIQRR